MKIRSGSNSGSVMITTMVITFVIGATLASFLVLTQHQNFATARSQSWNHALALAEAGVEDAMQMINKYNYDPDRLLDWPIPAVGEDGWWVASNRFTVYRYFNQDYSAGYLVQIDNSQPVSPKITAYSLLRYDFEHNHVPVTTATLGTTIDRYRSTYLIRRLYITTRRDATWTLAMLAKGQIDLNGRTVTTDSFNSADPSMSDFTWDPFAIYGLYDFNKRGDKGDIATNSQLIDSLNAGNAQIMGHVSTGPSGTVDIGATGSVGSEAWVSGGNLGIESGYSSDDMNVLVNDVVLPTATRLPLPVESGKGTNISGVNYKHAILYDGDYIASTFQGSVYVGPGVDARVYVTGNVRMAGTEEIRIDPAAEGLTVYMGGGEFSLGGSAIVNETGRARSFLYYGLPTNTEINLLGNGDFTGAIYAPQADFILGGGGASILDFTGASVTQTVTMNGSYNFHYDEDLANVGPTRGFVPTTWAEL